MNNYTTLVDASSLLLGLGQPLTKVQSEAPLIPETNPIPTVIYTSGMGEKTREKRSVYAPDSGRAFSTERFQSEHYPNAAPICDSRSTDRVIGTASRMDGRSQVFKRA
jgi:hypothetical protein